MANMSKDDKKTLKSSSQENISLHLKSNQEILQKLITRISLARGGGECELHELNISLIGENLLEITF